MLSNVRAAQAHLAKS